MKKELGGQTDLFDSVLASAVPAKAASAPGKAATVVANNVNGAAHNITSFYTYEELRVLNEDLPDDVDASMKEVQLILLVISAVRSRT